MFYVICILLFSASLLANDTAIGRILMALCLGIAGLSVVPLVVDLPIQGSLNKVTTIGSYLAFLFAGYVVRLHDIGQITRARMTWMLGAVAAAIVAYCVCRLPNPIFAAPLTPPAVMLSSLSALALFVVARSNDSILATRSPMWVGEVSYGVYVFHPIVLATALYWLGRPEDVANSATLLALVIAATVATAGALHYLVEMPCVELGRRVRFTRRPAGETSSA
jgi:peptidoglycan/LPS O-acetylase OafA/YrhL